MTTFLLPSSEVKSSTRTRCVKMNMIDGQQNRLRRRSPSSAFSLALAVVIVFLSCSSDRSSCEALKSSTLTMSDGFSSVISSSSISFNSDTFRVDPDRVESVPLFPIVHQDDDVALSRQHLPTTRSRLSSTSTTSNLPPVLQDMIDERREFELNLGRALDTLRRNYPLLLKQCPDYNIYHEDIAVVDPSGVQLSGLNNYKSSFRFLRSIIGLFYNIDRSTIKHKMAYDFARQSIRISFNVMLVPKVVGNRRNALYVDGISIYQMDSKSGKIVEHKVEKLLMNNIPVRPPYGMLTELLRPVPSLQGVPQGAGVPAGGFGFSSSVAI